MHSDQTSTLHDLVDQLTLPHTVPVMQYGDLVGHRHQQGLLEILAAARTTMIGTGGGGVSAHERSALNIAAVELHAAVQRRIRGWALAAEVPRHWQLTAGQPINWTNPTQLLRAWHTRVLSDSRFDDRPYASTLRGWINTITDLILDPPRRWTIAAPCPLCGQRYILDADGHQVDSLSVVERDPADASQVICRSCAAVWPGIGGARQLRIAIDDNARLSA
jgi:hypothetical protein